MRVLHAIIVAASLGLPSLSGAPLCAQAPVRLDPGAVIALAEAPWQDRQAFVAALDAALGGVKIEMPRLPEAVRAEDPFLWSLTGRFGADMPGRGGSGGIVVCSRYGLHTRDRLAEVALSDPEAFALFGATQAASDDAKVWPESAIARLACTITWNDPRRVAMLSEAPARAALAQRFDTVTRAPAPVAPSGSTRGGKDGPVRLVGQGGRESTIMIVESARIDLRETHQQIRFRAFLLSGGM